MFVQDGNAAIWVGADIKYTPSLGDRVLIHGTVQDSFRPIVMADSLTVLRHGRMPKPVPATYDELNRSEYDCRFVTVHAIVHSADMFINSGVPNYHLTLLTDGGTIDTWIVGEDPDKFKNLLDAEVEVSGVASLIYDGKMQQIGIAIAVPSPDYVKILHRSSADPWSLPVTDMDKIITAFRVNNQTPRIRIQGTLTYYQPGTAVVLQSGSKSLWINTEFEKPLRIGEQIDATGFPALQNGFLSLNDSEIKEDSIYMPIAPRKVTRHELSSSKNIFDLVSIEGQVVMEVRESGQDEYVLVSEGQPFSAIYRHVGQEHGELSPFKQVPLGSKVRVNGICILEASNPFKGEVPFNLLMRSPDDIAVIARPTLMNTRNLILVVVLLLILVALMVVRGWLLERKVRQQSNATARLEQRRSRILEEINASAPLAEVIRLITEMLSLQLRTGYSWCEIADRPMWGTAPPKGHKLRVIGKDIIGRNNIGLGKLFVARQRRSMASDEEQELLTMGARLAALAIETRRLYTDLHHRSEFDLLTDIHNRFSLDRYLDERIDRSQQMAGIFGLIYIDLDKFKPINDRYGHHIGDLYLQEVAVRMKRQLRDSDILARLGGDEFAALVSVVRSRADVKEIAHRLERCFDAPFVLEGYTIHGEASLGIALFPEDADNKDGLLNAADAAMYAAKNRKRQIEEMLELHPLTEMKQNSKT